MNKKLNKPELLAPAGSWEKMKVALEYGADSVYFGLPAFSLRARINKFDKRAMKKAADYCREKGKKFYVTLNIYAHNRHLKKLPKYFEFLKEIETCGLIISDPGIIQMANKYAPKIPIHLSTQANATNVEAVKFWKEQGIKRIILARELSIEEIRHISKAVPDIELEAFVHGAMCMSYSGRCILSKWMANRSANLGDCAQPCRWSYKIKNQRSSSLKRDSNKAKKTKITDKNFKKSIFEVHKNLCINSLEIIDDKNRFELEIQQDDQGTYFFNSYDLMLIEHLGQLIDAGVSCFKIEGRAKSEYYCAVTARAYRKTIDAAMKHRQKLISDSVLDQITSNQKEELEKLSSRGYWTGFLLGDEPPHSLSQDQTRSDWIYCGISCDDARSNTRMVRVHNSIQSGDIVQAVLPSKNVAARIVAIMDGKKERKKSAHGGTEGLFHLVFDKSLSGCFLLRKKGNI